MLAAHARAELSTGELAWYAGAAATTCVLAWVFTSGYEHAVLIGAGVAGILIGSACANVIFERAYIAVSTYGYALLLGYGACSWALLPAMSSAMDPNIDVQIRAAAGSAGTIIAIWAHMLLAGMLSLPSAEPFAAAQSALSMQRALPFAWLKAVAALAALVGLAILAATLRVDDTWCDSLGLPSSATARGSAWERAGQPLGCVASQSPAGAVWMRTLYWISCAVLLWRAAARVGYRSFTRTQAVRVVAAPFLHHDTDDTQLPHTPLAATSPIPNQVDRAALFSSYARAEARESRRKQMFAVLAVCACIACEWAALGQVGPGASRGVMGVLLVGMLLGPLALLGPARPVKLRPLGSLSDEHVLGTSAAILPERWAQLRQRGLAPSHTPRSAVVALLVPPGKYDVPSLAVPWLLAAARGHDVVFVRAESPEAPVMPAPGSTRGFGPCGACARPAAVAEAAYVAMLADPAWKQPWSTAQLLTATTEQRVAAIVLPHCPHPHTAGTWASAPKLQAAISTGMAGQVVFLAVGSGMLPLCAAPQTGHAGTSVLHGMTVAEPSARQACIDVCMSSRARSCCCVRSASASSSHTALTSAGLHLRNIVHAAVCRGSVWGRQGMPALAPPPSQQQPTHTRSVWSDRHDLLLKPRWRCNPRCAHGTPWDDALAFTVDDDRVISAAGPADIWLATRHLISRLAQRDWVQSLASR